MSYDYFFEKELQEVYHYINIRRFSHAKDKLFDLLSQNPNDGKLLYLSATCFFALDNHDEAIRYCKQALESGFPAESCNYLLGKIYTGLKRYAEAEKCFLEALRIDPQDADVIAAYGYLMLKTGIDKKAEQLLNEARRIDPDSTEVLRYCFYYYIAKNKGKERLMIMERYLQVSDDEVSKLVKIGLSEILNGNYKSARESFRQAYLLDPQNKDLLTLLEEVNTDSNIIFAPLRLIEKVGGPAVLWVSFIITALILRALKQYTIASIIAIVYISLCVYSWVATGIYKIITKRRQSHG